MGLYDYTYPLELTTSKSLQNNPQLATPSPSPNSIKHNTNLRRSVSLLELHKPGSRRTCAQSASDTAPYNVGNVLLLRIDNTIVPHQPEGAVKAEIIKNFTPFTMACVMIVRIMSPAMNLNGCYVLKAYDRRLTHDAREQYGIEQWSSAHEMQFMRFFKDKELNEYAADLLSDSHVSWTGQDEETDDGSESDSEDSADAEGLEKAYGEMFIHVFCLKTYRAEVEAYRRTKRLWGVDVPRFFGQVQVSNFDSPDHVEETSSTIRGVLLQYVPGFPLTELYESPKTLIPQEFWKTVINDGMRITQELGEVGIRNEDTCPRNTIVHWDPIFNTYKCKLIDFGHCQFRRPGWSDEEWGRYQSVLDEEGDIGIEMEIWLRRKKGGGYVYKRSEYRERLVQLSRVVEAERLEAESRMEAERAAEARVDHSTTNR